MKTHYDLTAAPKEFRRGFLMAADYFPHVGPIGVYAANGKYVIMVEDATDGDNMTFTYNRGHMYASTGVEE